MTKLRRWLAKVFSAVVGLGAAVLPAAAAPEHYPERPIRIVVPFSAGSAPDVFARLVGKKSSEHFKQPVLVEIRTGATGNIGAEAVARAQPDGCTLLASPPSPLAIARDRTLAQARRPAGWRHARRYRCVHSRRGRALGRGHSRLRHQSGLIGTPFEDRPWPWR
jgi:Tripartite tricarboxylate transporter family receptor